MKKTIWILMILASFVFAGCGISDGSKDAELNAFMNDADKLAADIVQKVKSNPNASGVGEAQKLLDGKKADLKAKYDALKNVRGFEVKEETMKKFTDSTFKNIESVNGLKLDLADETLEDELFGEKINQLVTDFNALYGV